MLPGPTAATRILGDHVASTRPTGPLLIERSPRHRFPGPARHVHRACSEYRAPVSSDATLVPLPAPCPTSRAVDIGRGRARVLADRELDRGTVNLSRTTSWRFQPTRCCSSARSVLDIEHCLLARPGTTLADIKVVCPSPVPAQCHHICAANFPGRRRVGRQLHGLGGPDRRLGRGRARGYAHRARRRSLRPRVIAEGIAVTPATEPLRARRPRTASPRPPATIARAGLYQRSDEPGIPISILPVFRRPRINLLNLLSRPQDGRSREYCFIIYVRRTCHRQLVSRFDAGLHAKQAG